MEGSTKETSLCATSRPKGWNWHANIERNNALPSWITSALDAMRETEPLSLFGLFFCSLSLSLSLSSVCLVWSGLSLLSYYTSLCLSASLCLSICPFMCLSICLSLSISVSLYLSLYIRLCLSLSLSLPLHLCAWAGLEHLEQSSILHEPKRIASQLPSHHDDVGLAWQCW